MLRPDDGYVYEAQRLTPRVHVIAQPRPFHLQPLGNVTVIEQRTGLVLVDAGGSRGSGERVVSLVREISPKPVTAVVLTHWHGDHVLGAAAIHRAWPAAQLIATERTRDHLLGALMRAYPRGVDTPTTPPRTARCKPGSPAPRHGFGRPPSTAICPR